MMLKLRCIALIGPLLMGLPALALAQETAPPAHIPLQKTIGQVAPTGPVPSLAVINSKGAQLDTGRLVLTGVSPTAIVFADRPARAAGHLMTEQFIMQWDEGKDSFAIDPPNATISVLGGDGSDVSDAVVTLMSPALDGDTLTFDVKVLEGNLAGATGPAAIFIDHFGGRFHAGYAHVGDATFAHVGRYGGNLYRGGAYWHAPVYRGAWYAGAAGAAAGAAIGAAAAAPTYYSPQYATCGYPPYPPC